MEKEIKNRLADILYLIAILSLIGAISIIYFTISSSLIDKAKIKFKELKDGRV